MANRDILVLNTTQSRAETQQSSDTVRIKGGGEILSVENSSASQIVSVQSSGSSTTISGKITSTANVSGSTSASFGRVIGTTLIGDAFNLTNTDLPGTVSSSAQIAARVTGSFRSGFEFTGEISGSIGSTGSFGHIHTTTLVGDASNLQNTDLDNTLSSSAQIATQISGAFTSGFEYDGKISGSVTSTGSFGRIEATKITGDASQLSNYIKTSTLSSSAQIADRISGSFNKGFAFSGTISGSVTSTGSFGRVEATTLVGDVSNMTNVVKAGTISGSKQISSRISGSFNKGFNYSGTISSVVDTWTVGNNMITQRSYGFASAGQNKDAALIYGGRFAPNNSFCTCVEEWNGTNWSEVNNINVPKYSSGMGGGSTESALHTGGCTTAPNPPAPSAPYITNDTEYWNGSNWAECANLPTAVRNAAADGSTADIIVVGGYSEHTNSGVERCNQQFSLSGNSWSEGTDAPQNVARCDGTGTQNSFFIAYNAPSDSIEWNGTSWSTKAGKAHVTNQLLYGIAGSANDAMTMGNSSNVPSQRTCTEMWNGYSWSVGAAATIGAQADQAITGHSARSLVQFADGNGYSAHTQTFEAANSNIVVNTLTANTLFGNGSELTNTKPTGIISGAAQIADRVSGSFNKGFEFTGALTKLSDGWLAGPSMIHARSQMASAGNSRDAVLVYGGRYGNTEAGTFNNGGQPCVEEYNGATWSETHNLPSNRWQIFGAGTSESALAGDGIAAANSGVEYYNGSEWAEVASLITAVYRAVGIGDGGADDLLVVGGVPQTSCFQKYDLPGNAWSELADPINGVSNIGGTGVTDAAIIANYSPTPNAGQCWNGSSWSAFDSYTINRSGQSGIFGTQNDSIVMGGNNNSGNNRCCTEAWDGTAWSECNAAPTGISGINALEGNSSAAGLSAATSYGVTPNPNSPPANISGTWEGVQLWNGGYANSGSFGQLKAIKFVGTGSNITNLPLDDDVVSGSAQLASRISGSFNKGFAFDGTISGSVTSTGSFNHVEILNLAGDASLLSNVGDIEGRVTSSAQLADNISGSFTSGFEFTGDIKTAKGVWSAGGALNTARTTMREAGTQNAALAMGGSTPSKVGISEEYNGETWSEGNDMITARQGGMGAGTQNAALVAFGNNASDSTNCTEEYNGTSYATAGDGILARHSMSGVGTQNAALAISGYAPNSSNLKSETELYDGNAFSEVADVIDARGNHASAGTSNSAIFMAGSKGAGTLRKNTEFWDGSSWSQLADLVMPQGNLIANISGGGTSNAAWIAGGEAPSPVGYVTSTEHWDGISWTVDGNLITARQRLGGAGDQKSALVFGGNDGSGVLANTEEYDSYYSTGSFGRIEAPEVKINQNSQLVVSSSLQIPVYASNSGIVSSSAGQMWFNSTTKKLNFTMDVNSWSAGGNMILARAYPGGTGIQNAAMAVGGDASGAKNETELYNGTAWSETSEINTARWGLTATGTQTSALAFGGYTPSPAVTHHQTEQWNGSNWTEVNDLNVGRYLHAGIGTQNAALAAAGYEHSPAAELDNTEEWNGSAWTAAADNNTARRKLAGAGTQNAGIIFGGSVHPAMSKLTETYDGTTWTERNDMNNARGVLGGAGTQNAAIAFNGDLGPSIANLSTCTEEWNGTSWSVAAASTVSRRNIGAAGSQSSGLTFAGSTIGATVATEEYSVSHLKTVEVDGV